ncbi:hypothetical protein [Bacillus marinisedimentorum]|uniref:hypothetical protein n=1 Tax=Bacillus marinisedimentorum TaxID=1821260 RepID=UPI00087318D6|nr:hypothetical protein [Bacillus marinisedimentorum]
MKVDVVKKRKIQQKYREKMKMKKVGPKDLLEAVVVISCLFIVMTPIIFMEEDYVNSSIEDKWMRVIPAIDNELISASYYTGVAIDFNPKPIKIIVRTNISDTGLNAEKTQGELINVVNNIIKLNKLPTLLEKDETYEIIIEGTKYKELKREVYR